MTYHAKHFNRHGKTIPDMFEDRLALTPDQAAIVFEQRKVTFSQLNDMSNRVAEWAIHTAHIQPRDVVALICDNCIEYVAVWLGLAKIGATVSLINTNLRGDALVHSFTVIETQCVVSGLSSQCTDAVRDIMDELKKSKSDMQFWYVDDTGGQGKTSIDTSGFKNLSTALAEQSVEEGSTALNQRYKELRRKNKIKSSDRLFYIYTSGTTGLPKAAVIKHTRMFLAGISFVCMHRLHKKDVLYVSMPLYHSAAGMVGVGVSWLGGITIVLRRKFSANAFMRDCAENGVTVIQYIGQIARYLMSTPHTKYDREHKVRKAIGNGMPPEIWQQFKDRFNIGYVGEFYASTEGNANLVNTQNRVGAIGYIPWIARFFYPIRMVKYNFDEEDVVRDAAGHCIDIRAGETGELINLVSMTDPLRSFDGYTNKKANDDKLMHDVFREGDVYFRTGDLVRQDKEGFIYFVDRIGDTYRWNGENVATSEVSQLMSKFEAFDEINVFGVEVKGNDGKAGMAAITLANTDNSSGETPSADDSGSVAPSKKLTYEDVEKHVDMSELYTFVSKQMASYQQPLFIRFQASMETTGTFKHKKMDWVKQGYDPNEVDDPLYFKDKQQKKYVRLTDEVHRGILDGKYRF